MELDFNAAYRVKGYSGVAWNLYGWPQKWEPTRYLAYVDSEGELCPDGRDSKGRFCRQVEIDDEYGEGEWIDDTDSGQVVAIMVGDDRKHTIDVDDLIKLDDLDYCAECGQISCCHDGRNRE